MVVVADEEKDRDVDTVDVLFHLSIRSDIRIIAQITRDRDEVGVGMVCLDIFERFFESFSRFESVEFFGGGTQKVGVREMDKFHWLYFLFRLRNRLATAAIVINNTIMKETAFKTGVELNLIREKSSTGNV